MNDLEITRLCAEAMGLMQIVAISGKRYEHPPLNYDPLHDDAQAMALVKRFDISISRGGQQTDGPWWNASIAGMRGKVGADLNRTICECVADIQSQKPGSRQA